MCHSLQPVVVILGPVELVHIKALSTYVDEFWFHFENLQQRLRNWEYRVSIRGITC